MSRTLRLLPRSLVGRVFALYTAVLVSFVGAGLGLFYAYQFNFELEEAQLRTEALAAVLLPTVTDSAVIGDYDTIRRTLERAVHHSSFSSASYIDLHGGVVRAPRDDVPEVAPPRWLAAAVAARLYDNNQTIAVGGRDYGVLRLSFAPERIAGRLWAQTRVALALALFSLAGGLALIRLPLVHWLGNLSRIKAFEEALRSGKAAPALLAAEEAPLEFRDTFEVLSRAAASLQAQRAQAAVTLAAIGDGVLTLDSRGRVVLANPAACTMAGCDLAALLGRPAAELLPAVLGPQDHLAPWAGRRVALDAGGAHEVVVDTTLSPILGPDGATAGYVLACRDISEQHALDLRLRAELQTREAALVSLRRVLEGHVPAAGSPGAAAGADDLAAISAMVSALVTRLQVRGAQLDAIFALSPDGFVSFDGRRRANYVSPAFTALTGIDEAQVLGADEGQIGRLLGRQCSDLLPWRGFEVLRREAHAPGAANRPQRERIELVRPAKRVLEIALREGASQAISQVLSLRDVTSETEVDQMKSEFLATAAHELRTPMASIYGFSELMMVRKLGPERQAEVVATIHRQTGLMIAIVNELLDLARIEARRGKDFVLETIDLGELATSLLHDFSPPSQREAPVLEPAARRVAVRVDRGKLLQAIGNVLSNAYKYSPDGGAVRLRVLERSDPELPLAGIEVRDEGMGMTPQQLARVSERFYRADTSGNIPGTGLGMSIVKEIVELLGGRLALASTPGRGTTVTLWLPAATMAAHAMTTEPR